MAKRNVQKRAGTQGRRWPWPAALVVVLLVAAGVGYFAYRAAAKLPGTAMPSQGNRHIQTASDPHEPYNSDPPTSGPHMPGIAPWGDYDKPIPKEYQVHNLEDGGVVIQYHCPKGCPDLVKKLERVFFKYKTPTEKEKKYLHLILAPYPDMDARLALTAWTRLDTFNDFDEARIDRFIEAYIGIDHHSKK